MVKVKSDRELGFRQCPLCRLMHRDFRFAPLPAGAAQLTEQVLCPGCTMWVNTHSDVLRWLAAHPGEVDEVRDTMPEGEV